MIFTRSWLSEFIDISSVSDEKLISTLNSIGFEVESYRKYEIAQGVVIGKVLECEKHPNADKLNVCQVDNGLNVVTIVCGASNVAKDQIVAVATLGAKLPSGLVIKQAELRGVQSFGMLCSASELGLEKINDGILVFDRSIEDLKVGKEINSIAQIADSVFEIDITPNRSDCQSIYGIARELASVYSLDMKDTSSFYIKESEKGIGRIVAIHSKSKTDSSIALRIAEKSSGETQELFLIDYRLALVGLKATDTTSKIVDYAMHATGVLLNIFSEKAFIKNQEEKYEISIEKNTDGIDIIKSKDELCQIGISQSETSKAKYDENVLVFSASYIKPSVLCNLAGSIDKKNDSLWFRSSKGSEPDLSIGLNYIAMLVTKYCARQFYSGIAEDLKNFESTPLKVDINKINTIIGEHLDKNYIVGVLRKLNFDVNINAEFDSCMVKPPMFRHDITNVYDLSEEILRIKGIDTIKSVPMVLKEEKRANEHSENYYFYRNLRQKAVDCGFFETVHFIFTDRKNEERFSFEELGENLDITNPITAELNTLRSTLLLNMLASASKNIKNGSKCVPLFESGAVFDKNRKEAGRIAFVWSGKSEKESVANNGKPSDINFIDFINKVSTIMGGVELIHKEPKSDFFHPYRYALLQQHGKNIGFVSALHKKAQEYFELPATFVCEVELDKLKHTKKIAREFSKFQKNERDLTLIVNDELRFDYIKKSIDSLNEVLIKECFAVDLYKADENDKTYALTIRFVFQSNERTLEDEDMNNILSIVLNKLSDELGIGLKQ